MFTQNFDTKKERCAMAVRTMKKEIDLISELLEVIRDFPPGRCPIINLALKLEEREIQASGQEIAKSLLEMHAAGVIALGFGVERTDIDMHISIGWVKAKEEGCIA